MIGETISHYRIEARLGEGGMGVVYRALDLRLDRAVALKFLRPEAVGGEERLRRFVREAKAAAALDHPNICTIYEIDEQDDRIFIAMALAEGVRLRDRTCSGPLPLPEAVDLAIQVARGLQAAHRRGIVHRDIKTANILITRDGLAKITDFGLAIEEGAGSTRVAMLGTPAYVSPEQVRGRNVDHRTDLWSWGVMFHEMLTGALPFPATDARTLIQAILKGTPPPPSTLDAGIPGRIDSIVARALTRPVECRYQSATELLDDLEAAHVTPSLELPTEPLQPGGEPPSIAVLPFADLSPNKDQDYFCAGIAEEIINHLARVDGLRVAARTSSFAFRPDWGDVHEIGRRLAVDTVLGGSVRKVDNRLRITVELDGVEDGYRIWSGQYDRERTDVFRIQEEIARSVVEALELELGDTARRGLGRVPTRDVEAYELYLRGRQYFYRSRRQSIEFAVQMLSRATEKDPRYALAHAGLADCHSYLFMYYGSDAVNLERARVASRRALELDPQLAEAHAAHGLALSLDQRYSAAESEFEAAMRLDPQLFEACYFYARTCFAQGKLERAAELFDRAGRVHPEDFQSPSLLGFVYRTLERHRESREAYRSSLERIERHLELNPDDARAWYLGATALLDLGQRERAEEWARRAFAIEPDDPYNVYGTACFYSRLGHIQQALDHFEHALRAGFAHREWIDNDSDLDPLREHPRFRLLVESLGRGGEVSLPGESETA